MQLEARQLTVSFGEQTVLRKLTLEPANCGVLVLVGPSGGGKSTFLRVLCGLLRPSEGSIFLDGTASPEAESDLRPYRRSVGTVFQSWNLFLHLTALENILLPLLEVHGLSRPEANDRAREFLRRFNLESHASKKPRELSGGQQQRIALIRALAIRPRMLVLDEPTSALDPEMTGQVLDMVREFSDSGLPVVLATHQLAFARKVAHHIAFIAEGRVLRQASSEEFFADPGHPDCARFISRVLEY